MGAEEEVRGGVYASVARTGKGNKGKNAYAASKSRKQLVKFQVNNTVVFGPTNQAGNPTRYVNRIIYSNVIKYI